MYARADFSPTRRCASATGTRRINDQIFHGQAVKAIFELFQPREKFFALLRRNARALVRHIRADITVGKHNFPSRQGRFDFRLRFQPITGIEQGGQMRINRFERAKFSVQEASHKFPEERFIARKADAKRSQSPRIQFARQQVKLRALSRAVNPFESD